MKPSHQESPLPRSSRSLLAGTASFLSGLIFALGLGLSEMTNPNKILSFLTLSKDWSPSLLFVMGGALGVTLPLFAVILRRKKPILDGRFHAPAQKTIDAPLILGSIVFGLGWGLSGYCPGPLVVSLAAHPNDMAPLFLFFLAGLLIGRRALRRLGTIPGGASRL